MGDDKGEGRRGEVESRGMVGHGPPGDVVVDGHGRDEGCEECGAAAEGEVGDEDLIESTRKMFESLLG